MSDRPTREEALQALSEYAARAELERIDALSAAEVAAELREHGVSTAPRDEASGPSLHANDSRTVEATDAPPPSVDRPSSERVIPFSARWRRSPVAPFGLAAAAAAIALAVARTLNLFGPPVVAEPVHPEPTAPVPTSAPTVDSTRVAASMRARARVACDDFKWSDCLTDLAQAAAIDPEGDDTDEVNAMRQKAEDGLDEKKKKAPPPP